ncbi:MAG: MMPL family transporter [Pseudomonadota bacterium]
MLIDLILKRPLFTLTIVLAIVAGVSPYLTYINIDASPDSLLLESDPDLKFYREVHREYGSDEFIVIGFEPKKDLYDKQTITFIDQLTQELSNLTTVESVTSITNVPLLTQDDKEDRKGFTDFKILTDDDVDIEVARDEFTSSPLYASNLVSDDSSATTIVVNIIRNKTLDALQEEKYELLDALSQDSHNSELNKDLDQLNDLLLMERIKTGQSYEDTLRDIREAVKKYSDQGVFYLAGAPLIASDIRYFIQNDIRVFGISILAIMLVVLYIFFRSFTWVALSLICAFLNVLLVAGLIGMFELNLTVISSNFVALLIIFSITLSIHVIIRYQEVASSNPDKKDANLTYAIKQIATPCIYMVATSAIAFISLIVSDIQPVIYFGLIMVIGLLCAFFLTFTILPTLIKITNPKVSTFKNDKPTEILNSILKAVLGHKPITTTVIIAMIGVGIIGIMNITVENRFIDYFHANTDIHKGLVFIDQELGGTVPLEIILDAPPQDDDEEDFYDEEFADYFASEEEGFTETSYWYNRRGINKIDAIHKYLEEQEQIGKVLSISSTRDVISQIIDGDEVEDFHLAIAYKNVPEEIKDVLINPYISKDGSQARILARIKDSDHSLVRNDLLNKIMNDVNDNFIAQGESFRLSGISVLYNNVLQSLYKSQILTLGTVFIAILIMLLILFRSLSLAIIGTLPNVFTAIFILGSMGLIGIPLDIMTITIAAITIGIGVDYAIHFIHRFKKEMAKGSNYQTAINTVQTTVGKALYYTSITVTLGFVILVSSNFMPSIYFGLFTSIAMIISLLATFTIIPLLLNLLKPIKVASNQ